MEDSHKGLSSSTLSKRPVTPKPSTSDENYQYYQQAGKSNLQSPKKPMAKNYMSPTISAASKAIASRKNILGERNEASEPDFSNTHVEKSPVAIDNGDDSLSQALPLTPSVFQSHDVGADLSDSLSSRPYDPVTNYLSPRPQFLRYKPNRCQELFIGLENGLGERKGGLSISRSGSFDEEVGAVTIPSSLASPHLKQEGEEVEVSDKETEVSDEEVSDEEVEESDEEFEEVEEENGWNLKGVLKSLLLFGVLVLFALHISTMNHETLPQSAEDGHCSIQNYTLEASLMKKLESGGNLWDQTEERHMGLVEVIKEAIETGVVDLMEDDQIVIDEGVKDEWKVEDENLGGIENADEFKEMTEQWELQAEEMEAIEVIEQEKKGGIDELGEVVALQVDDIEEIADLMAENSDLQDARAQHYQTRSMYDEVDHHNLVSDASYALEEEGDVAMEKIDGMVQTVRAEPVMSETMNNDGDAGFGEILNSEAEGKNWKAELVNHMKSKTSYTALVGFSIFSAIVSSLVLAFCFKQTNDIKKGSSLIANPSAKPLIIEQTNGNVSSPAPPLKLYSEPVIVLPSKGEESIEHVLSSKHSTEAASEELYHSQAPSVRLLGEFVVGEVNSSLRSCSMNNRMTESEESNYSVPSKKLGSKVHSVSIQAQLTVSEFSSPSHGSYTPQKITKKKEGGKDGEVTTPLRRSSRLRNLTVTSP